MQALVVPTPLTKINGPGTSANCCLGVTCSSLEIRLHIILFLISLSLIHVMKFEHTKMHNSHEVFALRVWKLSYVFLKPFVVGTCTYMW